MPVQNNKVQIESAVRERERERAYRRYRLMGEGEKTISGQIGEFLRSLFRCPQQSTIRQLSTKTLHYVSGTNSETIQCHAGRSIYRQWETAHDNALCCPLGYLK